MPIDFDFSTAKDYYVPKPTFFNVRTGEWQEVGPEMALDLFGIPIGPPRTSGEQAGTEGGRIQSPSPTTGSDWGEGRLSSTTKPQLFASTESGVPQGYDTIPLEPVAEFDFSTAKTVEPEKKSFFATREEEIASGGKGPNYPSELEPGNIDLSNRPRVQNPDGSISTVRSMSFEEDGNEVLIPTVVGNKVVSEEEAIAHYRKTGEHLGKFSSPEAANAAAEALHKSEEARLLTPQQAKGTANRKELSDAIAELEKEGYTVPHFIGTENEPEGDRAPTRDMENLVDALAKRAQDLTEIGKEKEALEITKQIGYWEDKIQTQGMSAEQWKKQTGEEEPRYPHEQESTDFDFSTAETTAHPVKIVTAYRPGGDASMGLNAGIEGADLDAHDTPILGRTTFEDYLAGRGDYVTVAMDKNSSWQGQFLSSPNFPGMVFQVRDNGGYGNGKTGENWIDIAFSDPQKAKSMLLRGVPFTPITPEQAQTLSASRPNIDHTPQLQALYVPGGSFSHKEDTGLPDPFIELGARAVRGVETGAREMFGGALSLIESAFGGERNVYLEKPEKAEGDIPLLEEQIATLQKQLRDQTIKDDPTATDWINDTILDSPELQKLDQQLRQARRAKAGDLQENVLGQVSRQTERLAREAEQNQAAAMTKYQPLISAYRDTQWGFQLADALGSTIPGLLASIVQPIFGAAGIYAQIYQGAKLQYQQEKPEATREEAQKFANNQALAQTPWMIAGNQLTARALKASFAALPAGAVERGARMFGTQLGQAVAKNAQAFIGNVGSAIGSSVMSDMVSEDYDLLEETTLGQKLARSKEPASLAAGVSAVFGAGGLAVAAARRPGAAKPAAESAPKEVPTREITIGPKAVPAPKEETAAKAETPRVTAPKDALESATMYHGTPGGAREDYTTKGLGAHFTRDKSVADAFAGESGKTHELQVTIKNPLRTRDIGGSHQDAENVAKALIEVGELPPDYINDAFYDRIIGQGKTADEITIDFKARNTAELERIKSALKEKGYDGIVYENTVEGGGDSYIAFDRAQIKPKTAEEKALAARPPKYSPEEAALLKEEAAKAPPALPPSGGAPTSVPPPVPSAPTIGPTIAPLFQVPWLRRIIESTPGNPKTYWRIRSPIRDMRRFWLGTADVFERAPGFEPLGKAIRDYIDDSARIYGRDANPFRLWEKSVNAKEKAQAHDEFYRFFMQSDSPNAHTRSLASVTYGSASPKGRELIDLWRQYADRSGTENQAAGVQVFDPTLNGWRPIGKIGANYFPRMIRREYMDILKDPKGSPQAYEDLLLEMDAMGYSRADAQNYFSHMLNRHTSNDYFGSLDLARTHQLPQKMYDYRFESARRYISARSNRLAQIKNFGQKMGPQSPDLFDKFYKDAGDDVTKSYIKYVQNRMYNVHLWEPWHRTMQAFNVGLTGLHLGNPITAFRNLASGQSMIGTQYGIKRWAEGVIDSFHNINDAYEKGIILDDLMSLMQDADRLGAHSMTQRGTNWLLNWSGELPAEQFNRIVNMGAAKALLRDAINEYKNDPFSRRLRGYMGHFKRLGGIDPQALLDEGGSGPMTDRYLRQSVKHVQGGYRIDQVPAFQESDTGKFFFKYSKWGTQQTRFMSEEVIKPAIRAMTGGKVAGETVKIRDPATGAMREVKVPGSLSRPIAYFLLLAAGGAASAQFARYMLGVEDRTESWTEILHKMDRDKQAAFLATLNKVFQYQLIMGIGGTLGNYGQIAYDYTQRVRYKDPLHPPGIQFLEDTKDLALNIWDQGPTPAVVRDFDNFLRKEFSAYRTGKQLAAYLGNDVYPLGFRALQVESMRQDMNWMRAATKRFESEAKIAAPPGGPPGGMGKNPMSGFNMDLNEALMLGDVAEAKRLVTERMRSSGRHAETVMESIKDSVRARRPIKAGGSTSEAIAQNFMRWADENMSAVDAAKIRRIDKTYTNTAIAAGILKPGKEKTPEDIAESLRQMQIRTEMRETQ